MLSRTTNPLVTLLGLAALGMPFTGCALRTGSPVSVTPVYYPAAPSAPRIAYLTSIDGGDYFGAKRTKIEQFLFGRHDDTARAIGKPYGVTAGRETLLVCDTEQGVVHVFDFKTREYATLGASGRGRLRKPVDVALDDAGNRYVADAARNEVVVFDRDNEADRAIGGTGGGRRDFRPVGVEVFDGRLYVLNASARRVEVLDPATGDILSTFGDSEGGGGLAWPGGLAVGDDGSAYVTDLQAFNVTSWDLDGRFGRSFGEAGDRPGQFTRPRHAAVGPDGVIYVVDAGFQRVQMFDDQGRVLMLFGGPTGEHGGLTLPGGVCCDRSLLPHFAQYVPGGFAADYLVFVTDQLNDRCVHVYAFGRTKDAAER